MRLYRWMILSRELERTLCAANPRWFPVEGEEAVVVGAFCDLRDGDAVAPHYRGPFVVYVMRGAEMWRLAAPALGKGGGYKKGGDGTFKGAVGTGGGRWGGGDLGTRLGTGTGGARAFK